MLDFRIIILDRRRHIAGYDLACVVEHSDGYGFFNVDVSAVKLVFDEAKRLSDIRNLIAVLDKIVRHGVAHKAPTLNILHSV